jgi:hypothetical protein
MRFIKLTPSEPISPLEFVRFWSSCYDYGSLKENLYLRAIRKKPMSLQDLEGLFEWKNGGRLSEKKKKGLKKITDKMVLINKLKSKFNFDVFRKEFNFISGAIWKIFLLHVIAPDKYPIFDQHVYRAFCFLTEGSIKEIPKRNADKERFYFEEYLVFFNELSAKGVSRKKTDEALWAFGKFLKTPYKALL